MTTEDELADISARTLASYDGAADSFWEGTRGHDVAQNYAAFLRHIEAAHPFALLDFGCGPGRDLAYFHSLGHEVVGLEGSPRFVEMARAHSGCEVLHQDFQRLDLAAEHYDGVFANASLFHVPPSEISRVLREIHAALKPRGVLFSSNPRGDNREQWSRGRYGYFCDLERWRELLAAAGFDELLHYYRPEGEPRERQPWLASVWRKRD